MKIYMIINRGDADFDILFVYKNHKDSEEKYDNLIYERDFINHLHVSYEIQEHELIE